MIFLQINFEINSILVNQMLKEIILAFLLALRKWYIKSA